MEEKQILPNSTTVLVLGICSIVFSCFFIGLILGIVGVSLSANPRKLYRENPTAYEGNGALNAGWIMSIIGIVTGGLYVVYWLFVVTVIGGTGLFLLR
ncbi:MAG: CCC motif membrane protein [Flavobacterium sp.]